MWLKAREAYEDSLAVVRQFTARPIGLSAIRLTRRFILTQIHWQVLPRRETSCFWSLEFHEWQGSDGPQYGNVATLEAAKQSFRAACDGRPKASRES
jgi:hypothetical protein